MGRVVRAFALWCVAAAVPANASAQATKVPRKGPMVLAVHRPLDDVDRSRSPTPWLQTTPLTLVA
ncbi:MAG: hypothetical protein KUG77_20490, partial [Nannocystaceae bacterium]|nr:hypothetical protein [Nannocystaceae bacterium]